MGKKWEKLEEVIGVIEVIRCLKKEGVCLQDLCTELIVSLLLETATHRKNNNTQSAYVCWRTVCLRCFVFFLFFLSSTHCPPPLPSSSHPSLARLLLRNKQVRRTGGE